MIGDDKKRIRITVNGKNSKASNGSHFAFLLVKLLQHYGLPKLLIFKLFC